MGEFETNNRPGDNQSIFTDLSEKADIKSERTQSVIAVCDSNEWAECVRSVLGGDKFKIEHS